MKSIKVPRGAGDYVFVEKRSKFICALRPVDCEQAALDMLASVRAEHRAAAHNVYAYRLSGNGIARFSDDGEPQGTAGMPVLDVLRREDVQNVLCVVTRYFGGVLLGAGGLTRAYAAAAKGALDAAGVMTLQPMTPGHTEVGYPFWERLERMLAEHGARVTGVQYLERVGADFILPSENAVALENALSELTRGAASVLWGANILGEAKIP